MIKTIDLDQACSVIQAFSEYNNLDELSGIEAMVKYYKILTPLERKAVEVFMMETKQ